MTPETLTDEQTEVLSLENGKYELRRRAGILTAWRYGETWRDLTGDKLVNALMDAAQPPPDATEPGTCERCGTHISFGDLEPTAYCNNCAQEIAESVRAALQGTAPPDRAISLDVDARWYGDPAQLRSDKPTDTQRLHWLHSEGSNNVDGYEWGIYRVKWVNGRAAEVWQTNADFSDLDAAMKERP